MAVKPKSYTEEHRLRIPITGDQRCYVISGQADFSSEDSNSDGHPVGSRLRGVGDGNSDERWFTVGPVHMIVGPKWNVVDDVSPTVGVVGVSFVGSDETDSLGY